MIAAKDVSSAGRTHTEVIIEVEPTRVLRLFQRTGKGYEMTHDCCSMVDTTDVMSMYSYNSC